MTAYKDLFEKIDKQLSTSEPIALQVGEQLLPSLEWIGHFLSIYQGTPTSRILDACYSSAIEACSLVSLGMARSAIFSLRSHYEFFLMFLYYKDHSVEWSAVEDYRESVKLPGEIKKFLRDYGVDFTSRWSILLKTKVRSEDDTYSLLSSVSHGSALESLPTATIPVELIAPTSVLSEIPKISASVAENLFDIGVCYFDKGWTALPDAARTRLIARVSEKAARKLFDV